ncbi:7147_t:CDS:2 [Funneliformis caledonium]|uniref:7147_t:CDS:1 n=1 Tax=Funneliformis caledonium TaxID=1117310 RepID=A0A9N9H0X8_9GLOM|nr:7147_t:CDS:2 [Funneliformis caledonium]
MSESFLELILVDFHRKLLKAYETKAKEDITATILKWIIFLLEFRNLNFSEIIQLMERHSNNERRFSSLIGIFYKFQLGNNEKAETLFNSTANIQSKDHIESRNSQNNQILLIVYYENKIMNECKVLDDFG